MSEPPPFRAEALAHHRKHAGPGEALRVAPRWTRGLFWALALAAVGALIAGALVEVDRVSFLPAATDGRQVRALMPAAQARAVAPGDRARLTPTGGDSVVVTIQTVGEPGAGGRPQGTVLLSARAAEPVRAAGGTLRVRIGSRSLLRDLVPGLGS